MAIDLWLEVEANGRTVPRDYEGEGSDYAAHENPFTRLRIEGSRPQ